MAGRPTYTGGRVVYDGQHAVTGERQTYTGQQTSGDSAPAAAQRGVLGSVGHFLGDKLDRAARDIKGIPGGVAQVGKAVAQPFEHPLRSDPTVAKQWDDLLHGHILRSLHEAQQSKSNSQAANLLQQTAKATAQTVKHPLRDPFQTATLLVPALHGVGKVGIGASEAADAVRAGASKAEAAKAAARRPETIPRTLKSGAKEAPLIPSRNAAVRLVQKSYDTKLQNAIDTKPQGRLAAHAQKRIGGALDEEARQQQKMRAVPASMLDRAAGKLSKTKGARREDQAALELTSAQTTAEDAAHYHRTQAANGVNARQNLSVARLYDRVAKRGLVKLDESRPAGKKVFISPDHAALAATDERLAHVQGEGDRILAEKGVREAPALQARVDAPGRVRAGASFEKPTPSKLGVVSPVLKREQARLGSLQRRLDQAHADEAAYHAKRQARDLGPLSEADASARLSTLDRQYEGLVKSLIPETSRYGGKVSKRETLARNAQNANLRAKPVQTVSREEFRTAEDALLRTVAKNKGNATVNRAAALIDERNRLRSAINARAEAGMAGEQAPRLPNAPASAHRIPPASNPLRNKIVLLGHALENQQNRVAAMEKAAASRVKPTGLVGGETARPGRGFISARVSEKKLGKAEASASRGSVVGAAKAPIDSKAFTGRSLEQGLVPKHVTASASGHFRQILRFVNTDARRRAALETGSDIRRSNRDVLVRNPDEAAKPLDAAMKQAVGRETSNVDTADELATQEGLRAAHEMFRLRILDRAEQSKAEAVGVKAPEGYKWVDQGALGELAKSQTATRGKIAHTTDTVNSAVTALTVYFKVGHVGTRILTNAATNIIQGSAAPREIRRSYDLWTKLTDEQKARALAAAGQHGFAALPQDAGNFVGRAAHWGAQQWARRADAMFRFNSVAYELRKAGYSTPDAFVKGLDALENGGHGLPAHEWSKLSAAARRADREAISYDRMNDFEKRYLVRGIWFYPWIKGSTLFSVRTLLEHPYKAAALGQAGVEGRRQQEMTLGDTPSYEAGLVKLFGGSHPGVSDFSTFSPFATAADVLQAPAQPGALAGFLNPVAGASGQLVYGLDQYGNASKRPYMDALLALGSATPEQQIAEAYANRNADQSGRMFHKTVGGSVLRYLVGPALPRRVNTSALAKAAARERSGKR